MFFYDPSSYCCIAAAAAAVAAGAVQPDTQGLTTGNESTETG
jgi:hypothetical protein